MRPIFTPDVIPSYPIIPYTVTPESPETSIARQIPVDAIRLLDKESQRRNYNQGLAIGASIVNTYVSRLLPQDVDNLSQIAIEPEVTTRSDFLGFNREKGMVITFRRRR
jgi:hypothetical protein